ncbi:hypothetical protein LINPERHAP2_LOCUS23712 [Linum perenne]
MMMMHEDDGNPSVKLFFHGIHDREYQVPATTTIKEVKKMIQPDALVCNTALDRQILMLQISEQSKEMTLIDDEDRTLESYCGGGGGISIPREVSIKYRGKVTGVFLKFPNQIDIGVEIPFIWVAFNPDTETVGRFRYKMDRELRKVAKFGIREEGSATILLKGYGTGRRHVRLGNYHRGASFARTMLNDLFGRWTGVFQAKVFIVRDRSKLREKQISQLFDKMSI